MPDRVSNKKILLIAFLLCIVCSAVVTTATVLLRPIQQANKILDRQENILEVAGLLQADQDVAQLIERVETQIVDLDQGWYADYENPEDYDQRKAAKNPLQSIALTPEQDIARINRRANLAPVYLVKNDQGQVETIVLPMHGYGLWSTLYGFLALENDTRTVVGITFYEHADTPGLGGEVDNPKWKALWKGKQVYDDNWSPAIRLVKGKVAPSAWNARYQVDALSGATLTNRGVENLVNFWLGDDGFGPYLSNVRRKGGG
jgi:Na+-transporting NADH:ubiquinone oxidoreductase subunit C